MSPARRGSALDVFRVSFALPQRRALARKLVAAAALLLLNACGGGGAGGGVVLAPGGAAPTTAPSASAALATTAPAPVLPASAPPSPVATGTCSLAGFQAEALQIINARRAAGAVCGSRGALAATTPLAWNPKLAEAALRHANDMKLRNFLSHVGSDGTDAGNRATAAGYDWVGWGEDIAAGQRTVAEVMAAWTASEAHCVNLMNPGYRDLGLACVAGGADNTYLTYWSMVMGEPR